MPAVYTVALAFRALTVQYITAYLTLKVISHIEAKNLRDLLSLITHQFDKCLLAEVGTEKQYVGALYKLTF